MKTIESTSDQFDELRQMLQSVLDRFAVTSCRYLTVEAAAHYTSLSTVSIRRLLSAGKLTAYRPVKGRILVDRNQLDAYVVSTTSLLRKGRGLRLKPR